MRGVTGRAAQLLVGLAVAACGTEIDPAGLPSIDGYPAWGLFDEVETDIPGHPDSIRSIYVNDVGRDYPHGGRYPLGTAIVKEIWERQAPGQKGALRYVAIMRKVGDDADVPTHEGWLFTDLRDGTEVQKDLCWRTCHKAAPWDGAWFDYGLAAPDAR
jgi:hypothetical protein